MIDVENAYSFLKSPTLKAHEDTYLDKHTLEIKHYYDCYGIPYKVLQRGSTNIMGGGLKVSSSIFLGTPYYFNSKDCVSVNEDVIYAGYISSLCWGHTITDSLARLWWIINTSLGKKYEHLPIYYYSETPIEGNFLQFIELLGISKKNLHRISCTTYFKSILVPDACFDNHRISLSYSKEYVSLIDSIIRKCASIESPQKILFIREDSNRQISSKKIIEILETKGFIHIYPERYSVPTQISFIQNAEVIVAEESSLSHNFVFCKDGAKVIILRKANTINIYQALINKLRKLDVAYIDCHLSVYNKLQHRGPFFLYANERFCNYFECDVPPFPYGEFLSYLKIECGSDILSDIGKVVDPNYKDILKTLIKA